MLRGRVFNYETIVIPMGTNCAPLHVDPLITKPSCINHVKMVMIGAGWLS